MEQILKVAVSGGYPIENTLSAQAITEDQTIGDIMTKILRKKHVYPAVLIDPYFWQALSRACGWEKTRVDYILRRKIISRVGSNDFVRPESRVTFDKPTPRKWKTVAMKFHELNLSFGFNEAEAYLLDLMPKK